MSHPRDREPAAEDLDPTGVRALLSSLPEPGPMPHDLAERITASLRQEQERRSTGGGASVTPLGSRRERAPSSPHHWLAAAAAVAAVAVAGTVIFQSAIGDQAWDSVAAFYTGSDQAADASSGGDEESTDAGASQESDADGAGGGESSVQSLGSIQVVPRTTALTSDTFEVGAAAVLSAAAAPGPADDDEQADAAVTGDAERRGLSDLGAGLTADGADACVTAAGADPASGSWVVGPATFDGEPAVLVIAGTQTPPLAWAVAPGCAEGDAAAAVLHGPATLP